MDLLDASNTDDFVVTALQIFEYCGGVNNSGTLHVDAIMDKFSPFVRTNKTEYTYLRSLMDPEKSNPEITVTELAKALSKFSDNQKTKLDLEESFNLGSKSGQVPLDSDSGISDGYQLLEDLQNELREKSHIIAGLRKQLEYADRQHEEILSTLTAERDSLRAHLNMLRDENMTLMHVRRDYEDTCERLCNSEAALDDTRRELDGFKRRAKVLLEQVSTLEIDKLTLQELLSKSKDECHRINEMYASRQSALLEQNESLKTECADLSSRLQDQEEVMAQIVKEKVHIEMELKDMLNKSNAHLRVLDRSVDVSYTDDQMLNALDSLNADSRFVPENPFEEPFMNSFKEDCGRLTNISLFDELRLSFAGKNNLNDFSTQECNDNVTTAAAQTDEIDLSDNYRCIECENAREKSERLEIKLKRSQSSIKKMGSELEKYEDNLQFLQKVFNEEKLTNIRLRSIVDKIKADLPLLEAALASDRVKLTSVAQCQTQSDVASVSTQVEVPCEACVKRGPFSPRATTWKRFIWDPIKSVLSILAGTFLLAALILLYNVSHYQFAARRCVRSAPAVPWRWISVHDLLDFVFRIEYVGEVPM